jgi:hypothetical protein
MHGLTIASTRPVCMTSSVALKMMIGTCTPCILQYPAAATLLLLNFLSVGSHLSTKSSYQLIYYWLIQIGHHSPESQIYSSIFIGTSRSVRWQALVRTWSFWRPNSCCPSARRSAVDRLDAKPTQLLQISCPCKWVPRTLDQLQKRAPSGRSAIPLPFHSSGWDFAALDQTRSRY